MSKAPDYEIENRKIKQDTVYEAVTEKITAPWWGTHTELVELLDLPKPAPYLPAFTPRSLSVVIQALTDGGHWDFQVHRWHNGRSRMLAILPPGWAWDDAQRCWTVNGVPVPPAPGVG